MEQAETLNNLDQFIGKLNAAIDVVSAKLIEVAPEAAEALLNLVQAKGLFELLAALIFTGLWVFLLVNGIAFISKKETAVILEEDNAHAVGCNLRISVQGVITLFSGFAVLVWAIPNILTFYNWLSAFYPEGAIALKALEAAGINL